MLVISENNKITGVEKNLLEVLDIDLTSLSNIINILTLQLSSLQNTDIHINNKSFSVDEIEILSAKNIKIFNLKLKNENVFEEPETKEIFKNEVLKESEIQNDFNADDFLSIQTEKISPEPEVKPQNEEIQPLDIAPKIENTPEPSIMPHIEEISPEPEVKPQNEEIQPLDIAPKIENTPEPSIMPHIEEISPEPEVKSQNEEIQPLDIAPKIENTPEPSIMPHIEEISPEPEIKPQNEEIHSVESTPKTEQTSFLGIKTDKTEEEFSTAQTDVIEITFEDDLEEVIEILKNKKEFGNSVDTELKKASEELGIDYNELKNWYGQLIEQIIEEKNSIYKFLKEKDYNNLHKSYHKLKGAALNLRLSKIAIILKKLDELSKNRENIEKIKQITDDFYHLIEETPNNEKNQAVINGIKTTDRYIEDIVIKTIQTYLETQDEKRFEKDKVYIERLLNTKINNIEELKNIIKGRQ